MRPVGKAARADIAGSDAVALLRVSAAVTAKTVGPRSKPRAPAATAGLHAVQLLSFAGLAR